MNTQETDHSERLYSIGQAAEAAGLSPATLRMWERRYGRPVPVRLPSGHRRFRECDVLWLKRVAEALARGLRPARVVAASDDELDLLLAGIRPEPAAGAAASSLLDLVKECATEKLTAELHLLAQRLGLRSLLLECIGPLVTEIGQGWADGTLDVRHEHFATDRIEDVLRAQRAMLDRNESGPLVVLTTLPGEEHGLGVQMAAAMAANAGARVHVLGTQTPLDQIRQSALDLGADAVGISVSLVTGGPETDRTIAALLAQLPDGVTLLAGGTGARGVRRGVRGVQYTDTLEDLERWVQAQAGVAE